MSAGGVASLEIEPFTVAADRAMLDDLREEPALVAQDIAAFFAGQLR